MSELKVLTFLSAALVLGAIPGQTNIFMISQGLSDNREQVWHTFLGVMTGNVIWVLLSAFGVSILIQDSPIAFDILRWAGVAYLIYIGVSVWRLKDKPIVSQDGNDQQKPFLKGILSPLTNPKALIFYISFLPQFALSPASFSRDMLLWGAAYLLIIAPFIFAYGYLGKLLLERLQNPILLSRLRKMIGGVLIFSGVMLLVAI